MTQTFDLTPKQKEVRKALTSGHRYNLVYGGSRSGKTFLLVYAIIARALKAPGSRHIIFRNDGVDAKQSIGNETFPKVAELAWQGLVAKWNDKDGFYELSNGSQIWLAGLKDKARLDKALGKEYATIYLNEASQITLEAFELVKSRLAQVVQQVNGKHLPQRMYVDLNPTTSAHWTYQVFVLGRDPMDRKDIADHAADYITLTINPRDNLEHLSQEYIRSLDNMPERHRRRFFEGKFSADDDNALWSRKYIRHEEPPELGRIVIAIDPAVSTKIGSDETGIIAAGIDAARRGYVLDDDSSRYKPEEWARRAISLYDTYDADCIVAEANQGGDMVASTIKAVAKGRTVPVKLVHATRGKHVRAEPIAALYEQGKVRHAKPLADLEDQMCLVAGTMIETGRGQIPIERVRAGDMVLTRAGWRSVEIARETGTAYSVVDIESDDGRTITCTPNHPVFARGEFVNAENVRVGDRLLGSPNWGSTAGQSHGAAGGIIGCRPGISGMQRAAFYTGRFGRRIRGLFRKAITFTISTETPAITRFVTSPAYPQQTITHSTRLEGGTHGRTCGIPGASCRGSKGNGTKRHVSFAAMSIKRRILASLSIAPNRAGGGPGLRQKSWRENAPIAGAGLMHEIRGECIAVKRVTTRRIMPASVYNLQVDGLPEFFANGILTHNCSFKTDFDSKAEGYSPDRVDALVWALTELFPRMVKKATKPRQRNQPKARFF